MTTSERPAPSSPTDPHRTRRAELTLLLMVAIWGVNFSVIKVGLAGLEPFAFNALRFPLAAALLLTALAASGRFALPERRDLPRLVGLAFLGHGIYQVLFILGMDRTGAGNGSLMLATAPIYTALLSVLLAHDRLRPRAWIAIVGAFAGVAIVIAGGPGGLSFDSETLLGDVLILVAAVLWALYTVGARDLVRKYGSLPVTAWVMTVGATLLVLIGLPDLLELGPVSAGTWAAVAYSGLLGIAVAQLIWYWGVRMIGSTHTATFQNLVPILAILVAWFWLGEVPSAAQLVGTVVIVAAVTVVRRSVQARR